MEVGISPYKNKTGFIHKICNINVLIYIVKTDLSIQLQMFYLEGNGIYKSNISSFVLVI